MARHIGFSVSGNIEQALVKLNNRLDAAFGRRRIESEYLYNASGVLTGVNIIIPDDVPPEDTAAFLRATQILSERSGETLIAPLGSGTTVAGGKSSGFETGGTTGFTTTGTVATSGASSSGPNVLALIAADETYDLSTTALDDGANGIDPGSVEITVTISDAPLLITDDGAGNLTGAGGSLPGGGTINYVNGAMTGTTAALDGNTTVDVSHFTHTDVGPTTIFTVGGVAAAYNLATTPLVTGADGIDPGSVSIAVDQDGVGAEAITDDGAGNLTGSGTSLPGGGTINYADGTMTGTTANLTALSDVDASHTNLVAAGPTELTTIGGAATLNLATTPIIIGSSEITPGSVSIGVTIAAAPQTITDDGAGILSGTGGSLPGGGTINYDTGAMTGTTDTLDGLTNVTESHDVEAGATGAASLNISSGSVAGTSSVSVIPASSIGQVLENMTWSYSLRFPANFGLNNNGVVGAQALRLEARLLNALAGGANIILRWSVNTHDAVAPTAWGTPVFISGAPTTAPTIALVVPIDATWVPIAITKIASKTLRVTVGSSSENFVFAQDIAVPSKVELAHTWGAALNRAFNVDDWVFTFDLPSPPIS